MCANVQHGMQPPLDDINNRMCWCCRSMPINTYNRLRAGDTKAHAHARTHTLHTQVWIINAVVQAHHKTCRSQMGAALFTATFLLNEPNAIRHDRCAAEHSLCNTQQSNALLHKGQSHDTPVHTHACMCAYACMYVSMCACVHVCIYIHVCTYTCTRTYRYVYIDL